MQKEKQNFSLEEITAVSVDFSLEKSQQIKEIQKKIKQYCGEIFVISNEQQKLLKYLLDLNFFEEKKIGEFLKLLSDYPFLKELILKQQINLQAEGYLNNLTLISQCETINFDDKKVILFLLNLETFQEKKTLQQFLIKLKEKEKKIFAYLASQSDLSLFQKQQYLNQNIQEVQEEFHIYVASRYLGVQHNLEWLSIFSQLKKRLEATGLIQKNVFSRDFEQKEIELCEQFLDIGKWTIDNFFGKWETPEAEKTSIIETVFQETIFEKTKEGDRQKNIQQVNQKQKQNCEKKGLTLSFEKQNEEKRRLVFYFRENLRGKDFALIAEAAHKYIAENYAKVFNEIIIVSRFPHNFPTTLCRKIPYLEVKGEEFKDTCSLYANTIHLEHGTPFEFERASLPILGSAVRGDPSKTKGLQEDADYITLNLHLDTSGKTSPYNVCDGNPILMVKEILRAIQALEKQLLNEV